MKSKELAAALYVAVYERAPDQEGLHYWAQQIENGVPYNNIADGFVSHPVFEKNYGQLSHENVVRAFYQNILGAEGDAEGIAYWTQALNKGHSIGTILASFLEESLSIDLSQQGNLTQEEWDLAKQRQDLFQNKVDVGIYYADYLGKNSNFSGDTNNVDVEKDPIYISASEILKWVDHQLSSVESVKEYIRTNYEEDTTSPSTDFDEWGGWLSAWISQLLGSEWSGNWDDLDDLDLSMFDGLNIDWDSFDDTFSDEDLNGLFNNLDGLDFGSWWDAYITIIIGWLGELESWIGGADIDQWYNDIMAMYQELGIYSGDEISYVGLAFTDSPEDGGWII